MEKKCSNCLAPLAEDANFCHKCGQSIRPLNQPLSNFIKESFHELLDIDGRFSLTFKTLLCRPGLAAKEFSEGKRAKYTPPLRLYLIVSLVFFLVFASFQHVYTSGNVVSDSVSSLYSRAMFVLFPVFAFYVTVAFQKVYYLSALVFSMHIHSVVYLTLLILGPLESIEMQSAIFYVLQAPPALYLVWHVFSAFKTMFAKSWMQTLIRSSLVLIVYMATLGIVFDVLLTSL